MEARIQKWGNSLALRIPRPFAREVGLEEGSQVELLVGRGELVVRPVHVVVYDLAELLSQVTPDNGQDELDWGERAGCETW